MTHPKVTPAAALLLTLPPLLWAGNAVVGRVIASMASPMTLNLLRWSLAFLLLLPLAVTSNQWAIRKLGGRKWQELHRNIYLIAILACIHYFWLVKATALLWPLAYSVALAFLLGWRVRERRRKAIPVPQFQNAKPLKFFKQKPD